MPVKSDKLNIERLKALGKVLLAECRSKDCLITTVEAILDSGAPIDYKNSAPLLAAAKNFNFELIKFLIDKGAALNDLSRSYLASMCDYKGFGDDIEERFFDILDLIQQRGQDMRLFVPYINYMAVSGRKDKLELLMRRYSLSERQVAESVHTRIIFEIINNAHDETLAFIEKRRDWIDSRTVDLCVSCDEWMVLEYILQCKKLFPSEAAVGEAIFLNNFMTLSVLEKAGYNFSGKPLLYNKALQAMALGRAQGFDFLSKRGYIKISELNKKLRHH